MCLRFWLSKHNLPLHFSTLILRLLIPTSTFSTADSFLISFGGDSMQFSHGCCRHCRAVGRFSGAKSKSGRRNSENSWASFTENLYLSVNNLSSGQNFSLRILFRSPCLSKKSLDWAPAVAICNRQELDMSRIGIDLQEII